MEKGSGRFGRYPCVHLGSIRWDRAKVCIHRPHPFVPALLLVFATCRFAVGFRMDRLSAGEKVDQGLIGRAPGVPVGVLAGGHDGRDGGAAACDGEYGG